MDTAEETIGIIAGNGDLPRFLISSLAARRKKIFVIAITGSTDEDVVKDVPHEWLNIGRIGKAIRKLRQNGARRIIMAGKVGRPPLSSLRLDFTGFRLLLKLRYLKMQGDDKMFTTIVSFFESSGFEVIGVESLLPDLLTTEGTIGSVKPDKQAQKDMELGIKAALEIGRLDIGQAAIVQNNRVLGVEGAEGTDELIRRCRRLHDANAPGGVLIKMKKPGQEARVDLPTIGINTVLNVHDCKLRGIALEAGASLIIDRENVTRKADELGIFIIGVKAG